MGSSSVRDFVTFEFGVALGVTLGVEFADEDFTLKSSGLSSISGSIGSVLITSGDSVRLLLGVMLSLELE